MKKPDPFLLTITDIAHDPRPCRKHFDVWHLMETNPELIRVDEAEFHEARWLSLDEATALTIDQANKDAFARLKQMIKLETL